VVKKTYESAKPDASFQAALRLARHWAPNDAALPDAQPTLESMVRPDEAPRLAPSPGIEQTDRLGMREVPGELHAGFAAFLDGMQSSRVVRYVDGVPIVHGTVAAVIRVRLERRMVTWHPGPVVRSRMYMPRALVPARLWETYRDAFATDLTPEPRVFAVLLDELARTDPSAQGVAPEQFLDLRPVRRVNDSGFPQRLFGTR